MGPNRTHNLKTHNLNVFRLSHADGTVIILLQSKPVAPKAQSQPDNYISQKPTSQVQCK